MLPRQWAASISFFTRIPCAPHDTSGQSRAMAQALRWAPLVGLMIGLLQWLLASLLIALQSPALIVGLAVVAFGAWITRGLHEDGLADYVDGLAGGWTVERRLEIMKDSRIGAFGTIALIVTLAMRVVAIASIATLDSWSLAVALVLTACLSRASFLLLFKALPPARNNGLSQLVGEPSRFDIIIALGLPLFLLLLLQPLMAICVFLAWGALVALMIRQTRLALGGHTGDVAGAMQQMGEVSILLVMSLGIWR